MIDLNNLTSHPGVEEIVDLICAKTQNNDRNFFRMEVVYFLAKVASCMRTNVYTKDRGEIPVNVYAICLAQSGYSKGYSVNIIENELLADFKNIFINSVMPIIAEDNLSKLAKDRAINNNTPEETELAKVSKAYERAGVYPFTFDGGTAPAVKQLRNKLLLAKCGSINLQVDEIGSNLLNSTEVLNTYLELYDQGLIKQKLTKNTADNIRDDDLDGKTPTNMLLFGTPVKLFDGGITENCFYSLLETGYARRCLFGYGQSNQNKAYYSLTAPQLYAALTNKNNDNIIAKWKAKFISLANPSNYNKQIKLEDKEAILLLEYRILCEKQADTLSEYEEIRKSELIHRYFRVLKIAGILAFIDGTDSITEDQLKQAIFLVEESGKCFSKILHREATYMKLAKYIANINTEVTHADLTEALPFYKTSSSTRNELISLAIAWGYKNNILIKKSYNDNIEFFKGETLAKTSLDHLILSSSDHVAYNYSSDTISFDQLEILGKTKDYHWCNHHFTNGHRCDENVTSKFNLIVLDLDGTCTLQVAQDLFKEYTYLIYTTKSHGLEGKDRFRVIFPISYTLSLDKEDYAEFMGNILNSFPFKSDEAAKQISKKWETNNGQVFKNTGKLLDPLPFIPKTTRNEQFKKEFSKIENLDNLERWFLNKIQQGNRNNNMIKYALTLVDLGMGYKDIVSKVKSFNSRLSCPLAEEELNNTIFVTVAKKCSST